MCAPLQIHPQDPYLVKIESAMDATCPFRGLQGIGAAAVHIALEHVSMSGGHGGSKSEAGAAGGTKKQAQKADGEGTGEFTLVYSYDGQKS